MSFAHVAVPVPARAGSLFSYAVPGGAGIAQGTLVVVPFSSRTLPGIVVDLGTAPPDLPTRIVLGSLEGAPSLTSGQVEVGLWMACHYRSAPFDALSLFLPPGWQRAVSQRAGVWAFQWPEMPLRESTLIDLAPGLAERAAAGEACLGRDGTGTARGRVISVLLAGGPAEAAGVAAAAGCSVVTIRRMVKEGLLVAVDGPHPDPLPLGEGRGEGHSPILLNDAQCAAFQPIAAAIARRSSEVFLLQGVTGSGKTHVYLKLIETLVDSGRKALVLVSEIAQTPEALERYEERFPGRVALLHSELPDARRWELWRGIDQGRFDVVIGPRSALFAPVRDLGLVVLDEEHEPAYKQEDRSPRYHAREVAVELGRRTGAAVVLGSATPDVGSYYLAEKGIYHLQTLPDRYSGPGTHGWTSGRLPAVELVDLRGELKAGNLGVLSRSLKMALERVLAAGEQAILFLNRRGASTCVLCRDCGHVMKCRRCDVPLVHHRETSELVCHQCNRRSRIPEKCPACKKSRIGYFGAGTERVEEEVRRLFPSARVLRWDRDVTARRDAHARIHRQFALHEADVLVGTQMVAKALDFPLVTLVGVVLADITLHLPDFRSAERTFQLLAQVAGRAGRGAAEGRVIIQTYSPTHYSVVCAARHDYQSFYEQEMAFRRYHSYPPFRRLARLLYVGSGDASARFRALTMHQQLQAKVGELGIGDVALLGPAPAFHSRVRGRYRWQIVLAGEGITRLLEEVPLPLGWSVDVDPMSLL